MLQTFLYITTPVCLANFAANSKNFQKGAENKLNLVKLGEKKTNINYNKVITIKLSQNFLFKRNLKFGFKIQLCTLFLPDVT